MERERRTKSSSSITTEFLSINDNALLLRLCCGFCRAFQLCGCTWCDVSHAGDEIQVKRPDTCSWTEAQLEEEAVVVLEFPYTGKTNIG